MKLFSETVLYGCEDSLVELRTELPRLGQAVRLFLHTFAERSKALCVMSYKDFKRLGMASNLGWTTATNFSKISAPFQALSSVVSQEGAASGGQLDNACASHCRSYVSYACPRQDFKETASNDLAELQKLVHEQSIDLLKALDDGQQSAQLQGHQQKVRRPGLSKSLFARPLNL